MRTRDFENLLAAFVFPLGGNLVGYIEGFCARTLAVTEYVVLADWLTIHKDASLLKKFVSLPPHAHNDIHPDKRIGHQLAYALYLMSKKSRIVATMHQTKHLIAPRLQRHMEMGHEGTTLGTELQDFVGQ